MSDRTNTIIRTISLTFLALSFIITIIKGGPWYLIVVQVAAVSMLALNIYLRRRWRSKR